MATPRRAFMDGDPAPEPDAAGAAADGGGGRWRPWVIGVLVVALVGGGIGFALSQRDDTTATAASSSRTQPTASASPDPSGGTSSAAGPGSAKPASPGAGPSSAPSSGPDDSRSLTTLTLCQANVRAHDAVIAAGNVGSGHWDEHVQAQTDAFSGKITGDELSAIFSRTRLAGAADVEAYDTAKATAQTSTGSCDPVVGAAAAVSQQLASCKQRQGMQTSMLAAVEKTMVDWRNHQADMARSRHEHVADAQEIWIKTWQAAPPNLNAWKLAVSAYTPPPC